jgi:hypothetical protein
MIWHYSKRIFGQNLTTELIQELSGKITDNVKLFGLVAVTIDFLGTKATRKGSIAELIGFCENHLPAWDVNALKQDAQAQNTYIKALNDKFFGLDLDSLFPIVTETCGILRQSTQRVPCIIGLAGPAGTGKTTLGYSLNVALGKKPENIKVLTIHLDDFIKGPKKRKELETEWDENHVDLAEASRVLKEIKQGNKLINKCHGPR